MFAALGRIYDRSPLLSLERIKYYIQAVDFCQHLNIIFERISPQGILCIHFCQDMCLTKIL